MNLIKTHKEVAQLIEMILASKENFMTLDTEFVRQKTFWPELCLLQIFLEGQCFIVDCLEPTLSIESLASALYRSEKTWVLHACKQDLEIFFHLKKELPRRIFDTQIAGTFLGLGESVSYDSLVQTYLGHTLDKSLQHTNWARRPLTYDMLAYAGSDVTFLSEIYPRMFDDLHTKGRFDWAMDEMKSLTNPAQFSEISPSRLKRLDISKKDHGLARRIFAFRDEHAAKLNLNRGSVLQDKTIQALFKIKDMGRIRELLVKSSPILANHDLIPPLLMLMEEGNSLEYVPTPPPSRGEELEIIRLKTLRDERATQLALPPSFLANNDDMKNYVLHREGRLINTWRKEAFEF